MMKIGERFWIVGLAWVVLVLIGGADSAFCQNYPNKPVRIIVPFTPGGGNDILARILGKELTGRWRQPVIIDNRPGGGGTIGAGMVAKAPADGYTLLFVSTSFGLQPSLYSKLTFDTTKDFTGVVWVASGQFILVVHPSLPVKSVKELIALAKAKPGQLNFASTGVGGAAHLRGELFKSRTGTDIVHVPYKGTAPVLADLLAGRVSLTFSDMAPTIPHLKAGKLRALAVSGTKRSPALPDVPTMTESGVSGFETGQWFGLVAPAGTPKGIVAKINAEIGKILSMPEVKERLNKLEGLEPVSSTPAEFDAHIKAEITKWAKVIKDAGIPVEN